MLGLATVLSTAALLHVSVVLLLFRGAHLRAETLATTSCTERDRRTPC
mgnify:CR=1 FL=1